MVTYSSDEEGNRESQSLKTLSSTSERKCLLFKGEFKVCPQLLRENVYSLKVSSRSQLDYVTKCTSTIDAGLSSADVQVPHI
jgi:hypothetical protein